jgi:hypothetical protein
MEPAMIGRVIVFLPALIVAPASRDRDKNAFSAMRASIQSD